MTAKFTILVCVLVAAGISFLFIYPRTGSPQLVGAPCASLGFSHKHPDIHIMAPGQCDGDPSFSDADNFCACFNVCEKAE